MIAFDFPLRPSLGTDKGFDDRQVIIRPFTNVLVREHAQVVHRDGAAPFFVEWREYPIEVVAACFVHGHYK